MLQTEGYRDLWNVDSVLDTEFVRFPLNHDRLNHLEHIPRQILISTSVYWISSGDKLAESCW
jgi:hypothetical protein